MKKRNNQSNKTIRMVKVPKLYSKVILIILLIIIILLAKATFGVYSKERESKENVATANIELQNLLNRKSILESETSKLDSQEGVEAALREKYPVSKEGEKVIVVVSEPTTSASTSTAENGIIKFWDSIIGIFKSK